MDEAEEKNNKRANEEECIPTASKGGSGAGSIGQTGPYKLLSVPGEGGCGIVYLAEQHRPVKRRLALKVIKPGWMGLALYFCNVIPNVGFVLN